jgi:hypothetical protein
MVSYFYFQARLPDFHTRNTNFGLLYFFSFWYRYCSKENLATLLPSKNRKIKAFPDPVSRTALKIVLFFGPTQNDGFDSKFPAKKLSLIK